MAIGLDNCGLRELAVRGDERGSLIAIEARADVPFDIARVYYIFGTQLGVDRGFHAHSALQQWAICVAGSCVMTLDDSRKRRAFALDRPDVALQIGPMVWREMRDFSADAVLMVIASERYDRTDYIHDYAQFVAAAQAQAA